MWLFKFLVLQTIYLCNSLTDIERGDEGDLAYAGLEIFSSAIDDTIQDGNDNEKEPAGVKVLREKSHDGIKKMMINFSRNQKECDHNDPDFIDLSNEFERILSAGVVIAGIPSMWCWMSLINEGVLMYESVHRPMNAFNKPISDIQHPRQNRPRKPP